MTLEVVAHASSRRISAASAWAVRPSARAIIAAASDNSTETSSSRAITGVVFKNVCTPTPELNLAVPDVGITWLGPAT